MPGRLPDPGAIRRNTRVGTVKLPAAGRTGRVPPWPLRVNPRLTTRIEILEEDLATLEELEVDQGLTRTQQTKLTRTRERLRIAEAERDAIEQAEKKLWRLLWRTPQSAEWERLKWDREVAQYVRHKVAAEIGGIEHAREARLRAETLGLTPRSMRALMWVVTVDGPTSRDAAADSGQTDHQARRHRLLSTLTRE